MLFATVLTFALGAFVFAILADLAQHDGIKIVAALHGQSLAARSAEARPATVRFSSRYKAVRPGRTVRQLRAAA